MISSCNKLLQRFIRLFLILIVGFPYSNPGVLASTINHSTNRISQTTPPNNVAPILAATGNQLYCPGSSINIVTSMTITDPDDTATDAVYIQISLGYNIAQDQLSLTGVHPNIVASWNANAGKLTLQSPVGIPVSYTDFIAAIEDVVYTNSATAPAGSRTFSITVGQANYLPSTGHYYQFVPSLGIPWNNAKILAEQSTYYGLQGYLATITAADEAQLSGEQAAGAGWIGGSDEATEGVWKWMTGPEVGLVFWNGGANGSTPNYAFWNTGEPNNVNNAEHYAHITAPGVGIPGSWNDLPNSGDSSGPYQPKGYIVEYGGMPGDPVLNISATTTLTIPVITSSNGATRCGAGSLTLNATASAGTIKWYDSPTSTTILGNGSAFSTPVLSATTTYYIDAFDANCTTATRTAVVATIIDLPVLTVDPAAASCEGTVTFTASTTAGTIQWFDVATGGTILGSGNSFTTPTLTETTTYYAEASNGNCTSGNRISATATIYQKPVVTDEIQPICENATRTLDAGIGNVTYLWSPSNEMTRYITVSAPGIYTVAVTSPAPASCTSIKTITVVEKVVPIINYINVRGTTVTIETTNTGDFEYSVDGINYQSSNVFTVTQAGTSTAFVRDISGCGSDDRQFVVLIIPSFFSPNNDGTNDYWTIKGIENYPTAALFIYDRYGKLITGLSSGNWFWDGRLNEKVLPATDYWFVMKIDDTFPITRGHFSLIR